MHSGQRVNIICKIIESYDCTLNRLQINIRVSFFLKNIMKETLNGSVYFFSWKRCTSVYHILCTHKITRLKLNITKCRELLSLCCTYPLLRPYTYLSQATLFSLSLFLSQMRAITITQIKCYVKSKIWQIIAIMTYSTSSK